MNVQDLLSQPSCGVQRKEVYFNGSKMDLYAVSVDKGAAAEEINTAIEKQMKEATGFAKGSFGSHVLVIGDFSDSTREIVMEYFDECELVAVYNLETGFFEVVLSEPVISGDGDYEVGDCIHPDQIEMD